MSVGLTARTSTEPHLGTDVGQMMAMELLFAFFAAEQGFDLVEFKHGVLHQRTVFFHDVKTEPHMVAAVAGEGVATDFDALDGFRLLRDGLFFDSLDDGAD